MSFVLTSTVVGCKVFVEISEEQYQAISAAKNCLFEALYLEQKLDTVIENYLEFEMELLASSTRDMIHRDLHYSRSQQEGNRINRRVVNLLSACRLYLDHSLHHLSCIYDAKTDPVEAIKKVISKEYDSNFGYRVMEAVRNYVQHRGFPVHKRRYHAKRIEKEDKAQFLFTLTPFINVQELREDRKFKKPVLNELEKIGKEIDIKPLVREYVAGIGNVHEAIRAVLQKDVSSWEKRLFTCIDRFREKTSATESILGLSAVILGDEGTYTGIVPIFTEFIEHRKYLERKNRSLAKLEMRYVTSEIIQKDA